jgi:DNA-binding winged helix-turn-helix (wHTH) protein/Tol biopolymer transport system component
LRVAQRALNKPRLRLNDFSEGSIGLTPTHYFEFGPFRADLLTHRLVRNGEFVALQPKAFDTLVVLLENRGRVVERAALMKTLWPDSFVEEANLTQYVFTLRKALGEQPNGQPYIETVPRRGYFFAAEAREVQEAVEVEPAVAIRPLAAESPAGPPSHEPGSWTKVATRRSLTVAALLVSVLIVASGLIWLRVRPSTAVTPQYLQLTNYADSATSPSLSPDGRMLVFLRGAATFYGPGDVYVKLLPDGQPFQLTHDGVAKMSPVFSPDGARIAYTTVDRGSWDTWVVPIPGGMPQRLLPNASGLSWIAEHRVMFSEIGPGMYMRIATAAESRADERDVYRPPLTELGMAHRSFLSPDRKSVLVTEMDPRGWMPCRLSSFESSSPARQVGPVPGKCTSAAWSPDGRWMYFSADAGSGFHIWRQRFPGGEPEQITFGATEEEGIAVPSSGRSLITSVGFEQSNVWLHDSAGDRQISSEGYAYTPAVSPDGSTVYYLVRSGSSRDFVAGELWAADVSSPRRERLLPGFLITRYDISADGKRVVFAVRDASDKSSVWLARLDSRSPPRQLTSLDASCPLFGPDGDVFFLARDGESQYLYRTNEGGTLSEKIIGEPVIYLIAASPDGRWLVSWIAYSGDDSTYALVAYSTHGGEKKLICTACTISGPRNPGAPMVSWTRDQQFMFFKSILGGMDHKTFVMPVRAGEALPSLPHAGFQSDRDVLAVPGARDIAEEDLFPGTSSSVYAFTRKTTRRNLYSIPVP